MKEDHDWTPILGIPCDLVEPRIRAAIETVLRRIHDRFPRDWGRILRKVWRFGYSRHGEEDILGQWKAEGEGGPWHAAGCVYLAEAPLARLDDHVVVALVAHELGHAMTREADVWRRDDAVGGDAEWASELSADFYANRWGFGAELREFAAVRNVGHHCAFPGEFISCGGRRYRVDSRFYARLVGPEPDTYPVP